jgi:hypothetical protein
MARQNRFKNNRRKNSRSTPGVAVEKRPRIPARKPPALFGKPFVVLEDEEKNTFSYQGGAWVPYAMTIKQCRDEGHDVRELSQKISKMIRYEVRLQVAVQE